jgi:glycosyltransferase involved in cell wall biosynthesis
VPGTVRHLVLGRICPRKGHEQAFRWLRALPPEHALLIAGPLKDPDDERYLRGLEATVAADPSLRGRVRFEPTFVSDTATLLGQVDAIWVPSTLEGMPNVAVEAACQGALVVMGAWLAAIEWFTTIPGLGVAVGPDPEDAQVIANALAGRPDREALAAAAREAFDLDRHVAALYDHLRGVADRRT